MPDSPATAVAFLRDLGAARVAHPGGTLLAHLNRVERQLAAWDARPALRLAGLCHACYGTDGFPHPLLPLGDRAELAAVIGAEAEALVHLYGSCDRKATYPALAEDDGVFHDRFTGRAHVPAPGPRRDFAELTAANELDLARLDPAFRSQWGPALLGLFTRVRPLLSGPAWTACETVLGG
ncbi:hypothetical protein AQI95_10155 [Streptomyces yokosukanensis]|uniref:DUF6817 domain-containing protein n=1 Tax=Streptomyces yokosukanensis TaxID=67386 RepID=A0A117Q3W6_9ACTN|nr:hypothetical protein [Streptomyces yokosukanensis]KUN07749.1 hypothetical protein AQI95_10155 [Streptomyces yokosukanensis]